MIAIIDYGVGNLFSLNSSLKYIGAEAEISNDVAKIQAADRIILPGVGAFADAARKLEKSGMGALLKEEAFKGKPIMGICLGMQLLFEKSFEYGEHDGLGLLNGKVVPIPDTFESDDETEKKLTLKIPHIGWNQLSFTRKCELFKYVEEGSSVYFVHSYYVDGCDDSLVATTEYGRSLTAAVVKDNIMGCQFHPEKSGSVGLNILKAFCEI